MLCVYSTEVLGRSPLSVHPLPRPGGRGTNADGVAVSLGDSAALMAPHALMGCTAEHLGDIETFAAHAPLG
jgi:hypothetical protein